MEPASSRGPWQLRVQARFRAKLFSSETSNFSRLDPAGTSRRILPLPVTVWLALYGNVILLARHGREPFGLSARFLTQLVLESSESLGSGPGLRGTLSCITLCYSYLAERNTNHPSPPLLAWRAQTVSLDN